MAREGRKKAGATPPRNAWETMLEKATGPDPTQAGEVEPEMEEEPRGGGDKGRDAETGSGGYGGDAAEAGQEDAATDPRPLDAEIHGDPRTPAGEEYPHDQKLSNPGQAPIARSAAPRRRGDRGPGAPIEGGGVTTRTPPGRGPGARRGGARGDSAPKAPRTPRSEDRRSRRESR
jgi:hypothetical protein